MWSLAFGDGLQWHLLEPPSFRFRYVITSYAGDWKSAHIPAFAAREVGALAACADVARHISCDAANVELVALKAADDGKGYVVRFRETEGRPVQTRIRQDLVRGVERRVRAGIREVEWPDCSSPCFRGRHPGADVSPLGCGGGN